MIGHELDTNAHRQRFDQQGIALQTVIIMVVLLAIAGGIAAVLLSRGGEAANQLEQQDVTVAAWEYNNKSLCEAAGHEWNTSSVEISEADPDNDPATDDATDLNGDGDTADNLKDYCTRR